MKIIITLLGFIVLIGLQVILNIYILNQDEPICFIAFWTILYMVYIKLMIKFYLKL